MSLFTSAVNVPYFGDGMETTLRCDACGFRHADFMILGQKEPLRLSLRCEGEDALRVRVIRSNSGTVRIPELGFTAEPTPLSESYVSNVEGVLERTRGVMLTALQFNGEDPDKRALLDEYVRRIDAFVGAREPFTLIIDDPYGNSAIVSEAVERGPLTPEEIEHLKTGTIIFDQEDLARQASE
jgi:zinc finger protein